MDMVDDDFGDLYTDVEIQASSAIKTLYVEPPDDCNKQDDNGPRSQVAEVKFQYDTNKHSSVADESDSEDDLNIVLNEDDCKKFPTTSGRSQAGYGENEDDEFGTEGNASGKNRSNGDPVGVGPELDCSGYDGERRSGPKGSFNSQLKYVVPHGSAISSNMGVSGSVRLASSSSTSRRGNWEDNWFNHRKGGSSAHVANARANTNSLPPQFGSGFSLPWYRTILEVDIDAFEDKPWRYPGTDIADYFNFGFNEDSWKQYCKFLEQFLKQASLQTRTLVFDSSHPCQAYEAGLGRPKIIQETIAEESKGRAIQVEDSRVERQSSMDVRHPCFEASDVVIQITVQDSTPDSSASAKEELVHSSDKEVSKYEDIDAGDGDIHFSGSASGKSLCGMEKDVRSVDVSSALRCSQSMAAERIVDAMEETDNEKEGVCRNTCNADPCLVSEPILGSQSHLSPTLSFSETEFDHGSKESSHGDSIENESLMRRQSLDSGVELQESDASDYKISRSDSSQTIANDRKMYSRRRSPSQYKQKHHHRGLHISKKNCIESDGDVSPILDAKGDRKTYPRNRSPVGKERRNRIGRHYSIHKENSHCKKCSSASPLLVQPYGNDYSSFDCGRLKERLHDFVYYDREDSSYYRERGPSCACDDERFAYNPLCAVHTTCACAKVPKTFREDLDYCLRKDWYETECFHKRRARIKIEDDMDVDLYQRQRLSTEDMVPAHRQSRRLVSRYSSFKEKDKQWREGNNRLQLRKKLSHDGFLYDCKHENELPEKYNRSVSCIDYERDIWVETYERHLPVIGRDVKVSDRRGRHGNTARLPSDRLQPIDTEDEYQRPKSHRSLSSWTYRESSTVSRGSWYNTAARNEAYYSRSTKRYHRSENEEDQDDGRFGISNDIDNIDDCVTYNDKLLHSRRRNYRQQPEVLHWMEDELIVTDQDDPLPAEEALCSYKITSKHEVNHAKHESVRGEMVINNLQLREGRTANCQNRNSNSSCRGEHQQMFQKYMGSNNLIIGERKSSVRCLDGGSLWCNSRLKKMGTNLPKEKTTSKDFNDSLGGRAVRTCIPYTEGKRNNAKQLEKLLVTGHDEDLDIEEGQVVVEDDKMEKNHASEITATIRNVKKKMLHSDNTSNGIKAVDSQRILETLAKMEKRRERFKDPITIKKESDKTSECQIETIDDIKESKQQRPARKRRWGAT